MIRLIQWVKTHYRAVATVVGLMVLYMLGGRFVPPAAPTVQPTVLAQTKEPGKSESKAVPPASKQVAPAKPSDQAESKAVDSTLSPLKTFLWIFAGVVIFITACMTFLINLKRRRQKADRGEDDEDDDTGETIETDLKKSEVVKDKAEVKKEEKKEKEEKKTSTSVPAMLAKWTFALALIAACGMYLYEVYQVNFGAYKDRYSPGSNVAVGTAPVPTHVTVQDYPVDVIMKAIAECESGNRQFEDDGKTPYKNRPRPGQGPSTAFGKYQFLESHREPAIKLGFDLNTEAGQDGYARYEIERFGTRDWEFDEQYGGGRACWGPKLREPVEILVSAPVDRWSEEHPLNPGLHFDAEPKTIGERYLVQNDLGEIIEYMPGKIVNFPSRTQRFKFKAIGSKPVQVFIKFTPVKSN